MNTSKSIEMNARRVLVLAVAFASVTLTGCGKQAGPVLGNATAPATGTATGAGVGEGNVASARFGEKIDGSLPAGPNWIDELRIIETRESSPAVPKTPTIAVKTPTIAVKTPAAAEKKPAANGGSEPFVDLGTGSSIFGKATVDATTAQSSGFDDTLTSQLQPGPAQQDLGDLSSTFGSATAGLTNLSSQFGELPNS